MSRENGTSIQATVKAEKMKNDLSAFHCLSTPKGTASLKSLEGRRRPNALVFSVPQGTSDSDR